MSDQIPTAPEPAPRPQPPLPGDSAFVAELLAAVRRQMDEGVEAIAQREAARKCPHNASTFLNRSTLLHHCPQSTGGLSGCLPPEVAQFMQDVAARLLQLRGELREPTFEELQAAIHHQMELGVEAMAQQEAAWSTREVPDSYWDRFELLCQYVERREREPKALTEFYRDLEWRTRAIRKERQA